MTDEKYYVPGSETDFFAFLDSITFVDENGEEVDLEVEEDTSPDYDDDRTMEGESGE